MADPSDAYNFGQGTWTAATGLPATDDPRGCDTDGTGQYMVIGYGSQNVGAFVSYNYGSNWTKKLNVYNVRGTSFSRNGQYLLVAGNNSTNGNVEVWRSSDYGSNFTLLTLPTLSQLNASACSSNGQYMIVGDQNLYLYTSSNYGSNWTARMNDTGRWWAGASISDTGEWQAATHNGGFIYVSSNYGVTWTSRNTGAGTQKYWGITISGTGQYMIAVASKANDYVQGSYYVSSNYGSNWTAFPDYGDPAFDDCWCSQSGKIMAVAAKGPIAMKVSSNFGVTWANSTSPSRQWTGVAASDNGQYILGSHDVSSSNTAVVSISPLLILPPDAPTNVQKTGANLTWTAPAQPVDLYRIFSFSNAAYTLRASTITSSIALTSLQVNTSLQYAVTASNIAGVSAYSVLSAGIPIPPGVPTGITADGTNLSWTTPTGGADFYKLYINNVTSYVNYLSTNSTAVPYSNLFIGSNIRYNVTANGNVTGESGFSASTSGITISFDNLPDNSVNGTEYVDALIGVGATSADLTAQLQNNTDKFETPIIPAGEIDLRSIVNSNFIAPGFTLSSFTSSVTTFLAISTSQVVNVPLDSLPASNALFYIPANQGDSFTLSISGRPYDIINSGTSSFTINNQVNNLGDVFQLGGKLFKYAAKGSLLLLGQGFPDLPSSPSIYVRPKCFNQMIQYSWIGEATSTFSLVLEGYSTFTLPYSAKAYDVNNLTNGTTYSAFITNNDGNKSSINSYFRSVQPGNKPSIVQSLNGSLDLATSSMTISWTPPASDGGATIGWYVLKDMVSTLKYNTYGTDTSIQIPFVGYSTFSLAAVNDPGYSPASTITL